MLDKTILWKTKRLIKSTLGNYPMRRINWHGVSRGGSPAYVIRRIGNAGFFSNYLYVLGHIQYALKKGYTPVIDMLNYKTVYNQDVPVNGKSNAWEYYFHQPAGVELSDAYSMPNVIISDNAYLSEYSPQYVGKGQFPDQEQISKLNGVCTEYIQIREELLEEANALWMALTKENADSVLGVHVRGTDMRCSKDHPIPPNVNVFLKKIDTILEAISITKIFLSTDENEIVRIFEEKYGNLVCCQETYRSCANSNVGIHLEDVLPRENHKYMLGKEVLMDALCLSKCQYLLCGKSNVPLCAAIWNNNQYKQITILE